MRTSEPMFNVPTAVVAVLGLIAAIHLGRQFVPEELDNWLVIAGAFIPSRYSGEAGMLPGGEVAMFTSPFTHMLLHGNVTHVMFNGLWLLAFGGAIAMRVGTLRFLAFTLVTGLLATATFLAFNIGARVPMIGASGAVAGLMGGTMRFIFAAIDQGGIARLRLAPRSVPLMPLVVALTDRRVLFATGFLILLNLMASGGWGVPGEVEAGGIAWEAHLGGYFAGLLTFGFFDRPQPRRPRLHVVETIH